jgi:hypothetical protein
VYAYDLKNLWLHGDDCGELNLLPEAGTPVRDGLRFVSDHERREHQEACERLDTAMAAALTDLNSELVEEEGHPLEVFDEAKRKADTVKEDDINDAGPSATGINIDSDSSSFDCDED